MNQLSTYTHLESLVLWESVLQEGVEPAAWPRISDRLLKNEFIKTGDNFDVKRLHSDALEKWFFTTLHQELLIEDHGILNGDGATSPGGTGKRKLDGGSPPATLKDLAENLEKVPRIIDRLWERYKTQKVKEIRQKEDDYDQTQREIYVLEKNQAERSKRLARENGQAQAALSPKEIKPATPKLPHNTPVPPPTATPAHPPPVPSAQTAPARGQSVSSPAVQPKPPTPNPPIALPAQHPAQPPPAVPSGPVLTPSTVQGQPANAGSPVLQALNSAHQQPQRVLQAPQQQHPAKVPISPRPNTTTPVPASAEGSIAPQPAGVANGPGQGGLKWEKPYQPPGAVPHPQHPPRPVPSPAAPRAATPQQYAQHQQQWQQQQQQQQGQYQQKSQAVAPGSQQPQSQPPLAQQNHPQSQPPPHQPSQPSPVLVAPQNAGQVVPQIPAATATARAADAGSAASPQPRPQTKTPVPPPPHRPTQPQQPQSAPQPRPIAAASPLPQSHNGLAAPPQRWPPGQLPPGQRISPPTGASTPTPQQAPKDQKPMAAPHGPQQPRPAIPEHVLRQAATPVSRRVSAAAASLPTTPLQLGLPAKGGLITSWTRSPTPSTPKPTDSQEVESPAWEPLSPPKPQSTTLPVPRKAPGWTTQSHLGAPPPLQTPTAPSNKLPLPAQSGRRTKRTSTRKLREATGTPLGEGRRRSDSVVSGTDELALDHPDTMPKVKDETSGHEEGGDTTADESVAHRNFATPGSVSRILKRKRQETPLEPPGPPTQVLWTRGFHKVSYQALDQIASHRDGNMFLKPVRERDAPNYRQIVLQPQDMTAIRAAVKGGNQAATQAAANLPNGDPGTPGVWLPISDDLRPPKGIVNSAQLERELCHMFCNAIMYNPDPNRGPGQVFMRRTQEEDDDVLGYHLDENAVVSNTQAMFIEVEKQMGDLRAAEKDRSGPAPSLTSRPGSVATPADDTAEEEDELAADGDMTSGTAKRRRVKP